MKRAFDSNVSRVKPRTRLLETFRSAEEEDEAPISTDLAAMIAGQRGERSRTAQGNRNTKQMARAAAELAGSVAADVAAENRLAPRRRDGLALAEERLADQASEAAFETSKQAGRRQGESQKAKAEEEARLAKEQVKAEEEARLAKEQAKAEEEARLAKEQAKAEEEARLAKEQAKAEEEARLAKEQAKAEEEARLAKERAKAEEEARLAKEQAKAEEEARLVKEQAKAEEEARLAKEQAKAEEEARLAKEQAKAEEEARLAKEQAKAEEEARLAKERQRRQEELLSADLGSTIRENIRLVARKESARGSEDSAGASLSADLLGTISRAHTRMRMGAPGEETVREGRARIEELRSRLKATGAASRAEPPPPAGAAAVVRQAVTELRDRLQTVVDERDRLARVLESTRDDLRRVSQELVARTGALEAAQKLAQEREQVAEALASEAEALAEERDQALSRILELRTLDEQQTRLLAEAEQALIERDQRSEAAEAESRELIAIIDAQAVELEDLQARLQEQREERDETAARNKELEAELERLRGTKEALAEIHRLVTVD